uniref:Uncharacterized protein n=1 Tax=Helianthus annuus TaxID=4232 RepID=A0A251SGR5_HELAN
MVHTQNPSASLTFSADPYVGMEEFHNHETLALIIFPVLIQEARVCGFVFLLFHKDLIYILHHWLHSILNDLLLLWLI